MLPALVWVLNTSPKIMVSSRLFFPCGLFTHQITSCIPFSFFSWNGVVIICLTNHVTYSLITLRFETVCSVTPTSPVVLISHCNPRCVLLPMHLISYTLCACFFIPVCYLMLSHCLECRYLALHSVYMYLTGYIYNIVTFLESLLFFETLFTTKWV